MDALLKLTGEIEKYVKDGELERCPLSVLDNFLLDVAYAKFPDESTDDASDWKDEYEGWGEECVNGNLTLFSLMLIYEGQEKEFYIDGEVCEDGILVNTLYVPREAVGDILLHCGHMPDEYKESDIVDDKPLFPFGANFYIRMWWD